VTTARERTSEKKIPRREFLTETDPLRELSTQARTGKKKERLHGALAPLQFSTIIEIMRTRISHGFKVCPAIANCRKVTCANIT
jgi:hypothetical protein